MNISYAILACNEHRELEFLLGQLFKKITADDEVVVLLDTDNFTKEVEGVCKQYDILPNFSYHFNSLKKDFANQKNVLKGLCTKDWIFNIDADEYLSEELLDSIKDIIEINNGLVDVIAVPRINEVVGLTDEHIRKWGWRVDSRMRVNWPDYQLRIFKNVKHINWEGKVHETLVGYDYFTSLPIDVDDYTLIHIKDIKRQEIQNSLYETI